MTNYELIKAQPTRKFFELALLEHLDQNLRTTLKISYPQFKRDALKYCCQACKINLVAPIKTLALDLVNRMAMPQFLQLKYKIIDKGHLL